MPDSNVPVVKNSSKIERQVVTAGNATEFQVLLGEGDRTPNFAMRRFIMGEGGGMPRHTNTVEHEQYVLRGAAEISIGDETHAVSADDVVYIPAGVPHSYRVTSDEPFEFLCMVPNLPDEVRLDD